MVEHSVVLWLTSPHGGIVSQFRGVLGRGKSLDKGGAKYHREVLHDNIQDIAKTAV